MPSRHLLRVASQLKFLVSTIIHRELNDPRIGFVTVLSVEPTEDFKEAKVLVSVLGGPGAESRTLHGLDAARAYIQKRIAKSVRLRHMPTLRFELDTSQRRTAQLETLIEETRAEDRARREED